jgi:hypothetical protein
LTLDAGRGIQQMDDSTKISEAERVKGVPLSIRQISVARDWWVVSQGDTEIAEFLDEPDAWLFRAAGDLLDVCRRLVVDRDSLGIQESDPDDPMAIIVRAARAAVEKADRRAA